MALRRLAQTNHAATVGSPRSPQEASAPDSPAGSPMGSMAPTTPRNRVSIGTYRSPASTPSISSSVPFDWDAARSRRPPPYASPLQNNRGRTSMGTGSTTPGTPKRKAVIRKKGILERITSIPSTIAFEIALFPHNVPLPTPTKSAILLGGFMHFLHLCIRITQVSKVPDSELGWEDLYGESEGISWFDWTVPVSILLLSVSCLNALNLFSRIKLYRLHQKPDPVSSPNARFVSAQLDFEPLELPSLPSRIRAGIWFALSCSWRFLLGMQPPPSPGQMPGKMSRVQQIDVWSPGDMEIVLFAIYSPAHSLMWMATGSSNWIFMIVLMVIMGAQLYTQTRWFNTLLKDKEIIAAEVLNEYNQGFVYPRINPIRKDVAVMTHQSEIVNVWED
ncbi:hypothetical protein BDZ94DRAFT_1255737 [Collybia nuda]|uniref:Nuclear rim protein 1 n=1 Tax=Collybia nuda TaxID=64659 RepID=A0A9P5Y9R3_9AGAR|nr:hypothetical protein BDZ94DRAFT_1255737 [Collybia nuda]